MSKQIQLVDGRQVDIMEANDAIRDILRDCDRGDPLTIFADRYPLADVANWENAIATRGKMWDITRYAERVKGADTDHLQNVVHQRGEPYDVYQFAITVKGANTQKALDRLCEVLDTGDLHSIDPDITGYIRNLKERISVSHKQRSSTTPK